METHTVPEITTYRRVGTAHCAGYHQTGYHRVFVLPDGSRVDVTVAMARMLWWLPQDRSYLLLRSTRDGRQLAPVQIPCRCGESAVEALVTQWEHESVREGI